MKHPAQAIEQSEVKSIALPDAASAATGFLLRQLRGVRTRRSVTVKKISSSGSCSMPGVGVPFALAGQLRCWAIGRRPGACGLRCTQCCDLGGKCECDGWSRAGCSRSVRSRLACCLPTMTAVSHGTRRSLLAAAKRERCQMALAALLLAAATFAAWQDLPLQAAR